MRLAKELPTANDTQNAYNLGLLVCLLIAFFNLCKYIQVSLRLKQIEKAARECRSKTEAWDNAVQWIRRVRTDSSKHLMCLVIFCIASFGIGMARMASTATVIIIACIFAVVATSSLICFLHFSSGENRLKIYFLGCEYPLINGGIGYIELFISTHLWAIIAISFMIALLAERLSH